MELVSIGGAGVAPSSVVELLSVVVFFAVPPPLSCLIELNPL